MTEIILHDVTAVRVERISPDNGNHTQLVVTSRGVDVVLSLFSMPHDLMMTLARALGDHMSTANTHDRGRISLTDYVTFHDVTAKMEDEK